MHSNGNKLNSTYCHRFKTPIINKILFYLGTHTNFSFFNFARKEFLTDTHKDTQRANRAIETKMMTNISATILYTQNQIERILLNEMHPTHRRHCLYSNIQNWEKKISTFFVAVLLLLLLALCQNE